MAGSALSTVASEEFRSVVGRFASGVTVITANREGEPRGTTASAFTSVSLEPPIVLICLNRTSETGQAVADARRFAVNILAEDQAHEATVFAGKGDDKFLGIGWHPGRGGEPLLNGALATLECSVSEVATGGTHWVFFGEVEHAQAREGSPLAYFRGRFGRLELAQDDEVFAALRGLVLNREVEVDSPLSLDELAQRLDTPRGPIFYGLTRLVGEGLVARDASGAFSVRPLSAEAVAEAWRARCAIELGAATLAVGGLEPAAVEELGALCEAARPVSRADFKLGEWLPAYQAFRERVVELAGSASLSDAYRRINAPAAILSVTQAAMERAGLDWEQCQRAYEQQHDLVEAYRQGDLAAAHDAIRRHEALAQAVAAQFMEERGGTV